MSSIGMRILEERERLALTQPELAAKCGVTMRSQRNYEKGERSPDADYLAALAAQGLDVLYILTGQRGRTLPASALLPEPDRILLDNFHAAPDQVQAGIKTTLGAFSAGPRRGKAA